MMTEQSNIEENYRMLFLDIELKFNLACVGSGDAELKTLVSKHIDEASVS